MIQKSQSSFSLESEKVFKIEDFLLKNKEDKHFSDKFKKLLVTLNKEEVRNLLELCEAFYKFGYKDALFYTRENSKNNLIQNSPSIFYSEEKFKKKIYKAISEVLQLVIKDQVATLPIIPKVAQKVLKLLENPNLTIKMITEELLYDQGITSKLISKANTAYYGSVTIVDNLEKAIIKIGLNEVKQILFLFATKEIYNINHPFFNQLGRDLANHAAASANIADTVSKIKKTPISANLLTKALFHDVGKLWLLNIICATLEKEEEYVLNSARQLIFSIFEAFHVRLCCLLLRKWNFNYEMINSIKEIHLHFDGSNQENCILQFSNYFAKVLGYSVEDFTLVPEKLQLFKNLLYIGSQELELIENELKKAMSKHLI